MAAPSEAAVEAFKQALATAASVSAYAMLARGMAGELLPDELRAAVHWGAAFVRSRFGARDKERHTIIIRHYDNGSSQNSFFDAARASSWSTLLSMEDGGSVTDHFDGVEFRWAFMEAGGDDGNRAKGGGETLELSFDAEHADTALDKYVPFISSTAEELRRQDRALKIFMNDYGFWQGMNHHHPASFETLAMDPGLKQAVLDDLDRFLKRKEYYQRIGKAWKRGYLLYGPPGTGKSSLVAAMANHLRFNLYDLDLSSVHDNSCLQKLLIDMSNKSILVIEDIDCSFDTMSREDRKDHPDEDDGRDNQSGDERKMTLSGLLNFIDGLWSTSGEERIIIFTTNYKDRLDPALLRPGRMDMHVYMGYCCWEAFRKLAWNYHLIDDHPLFPGIQESLAGVEVTPAEVSEMLLRSEDADVALRVLLEFLQERRGAIKESEDKHDA
ncbi:hypothetical protein VPH35_036567 [Triticum aestivum]